MLLEQRSEGAHRRKGAAPVGAENLVDQSVVQQFEIGVRDEARRSGAVDEQVAARVAARRHSRCDLLVNCAGTTRFVPHADLELLDDGLIDEVFRTNWRGAFAAVRAFRPLLEQHGGLVVNISSVAAILGTGSNVAYCASKAAMDCMTRSLARALAPRIRVVSVSPGLVGTEFIKNLDPAWRKDQLARTPLGRLVQPEEIGDAVLAAATLLQPLTGCIIPVDGGRPLA